MTTTTMFPWQVLQRPRHYLDDYDDESIPLQLWQLHYLDYKDNYYIPWMNTITTVAIPRWLCYGSLHSLDNYKNPLVFILFNSGWSKEVSAVNGFDTSVSQFINRSHLVSSTFSVKEMDRKKSFTQAENKLILSWNEQFKLNTMKMSEILRKGEVRL